MRAGRVAGESGGDQGPVDPGAAQRLAARIRHLGADLVHGVDVGVSGVGVGVTGEAEADAVQRRLHDGGFPRVLAPQAAPRDRLHGSADPGRPARIRVHVR